MVKIDWVEIPAGEFLMGLSEEQVEQMRKQLPAEVKTRLRDGFYEAVDFASETSQRIVWLDTFYIARFPITIGQYHEFILSGHPYADPWGERYLATYEEEPRNHPSLAIWHNADAFCHWIGGRLPTSAEWEKAGRGADGRLYPWGDEWDPSRGNFSTEQEAPRIAGSKVTPVDTYPDGVSSYGVWDMMGNVREWTLAFEGDSQTRMEYPVVKGSCADDDERPLWFEHRVTRHRHGSLIPQLSPPYTGFRPVMDKWHRQYWPGFRVETEGKDEA
jgi:formylglycine-generating enzyme required for sulfatase activity